jgi:ComF family protein
LVGDVVGAVESALAVLVPPLCVVCGSGLRGWEKWLCRRCDLLVSMGARPREKHIDLGRFGFMPASYGLEYTEPVSGLVREMKYGGKPGLASFLGRFLWVGAGELFSLDDPGRVLVPVPIHPRKRRERGYNQAEVLSRCISALSGLPVAARALAKRVDTPPQAGLERDMRLCNVAGSIKAGDAGPVRGRSIILVDDVVTTGSTLRECAVTLLECGAKGVQACAVASSG